MSAMKAKMFLLIAGLSVAVLLGSAPAIAQLDCEVVSSSPATILTDANGSDRVGCPTDRILTGGGELCLETRTTNVKDIDSTAYPANGTVTTPAQMNCSWDNHSGVTVDCECRALCCKLAQPPQPNFCSHSLCSEPDVKLTAGCLPRAAEAPHAPVTGGADICACDPFCCNNKWDAICVREAIEICGSPCTSDRQCDPGCSGVGNCP